MAWTAKVETDRDNPASGTAMAIWEEGTPAMFLYKAAAAMTEEAMVAFVADAKAALTAELAGRELDPTYSELLATALNA
jgi:hypothetical protein